MNHLINFPHFPPLKREGTRRAIMGGGEGGEEEETRSGESGLVEGENWGRDEREEDPR
jgi:hypothetical protein